MKGAWKSDPVHYETTVLQVKQFSSFETMILFLQVIRHSGISSRKATEEDNDSDAVEKSDQEDDEL